MSPESDASLSLRGFERVAASGRGLSVEQRRALQMLAGSENGCTEPALRRHGFSVRLLVGLAQAGLVVTKPEIMKAAGRSFGVVRFAITALGRETIGH
jgi:hypothetical protein